MWSIMRGRESSCNGERAGESRLGAQRPTKSGFSSDIPEEL